MNTRKFLNLTTPSTCGSQNLIALIVPYVPLPFRLVSYSCWSSGHCSLPPDRHYLVTSTFSNQCLLRLSNPSSPPPCTRSSIDSFNILFLTCRKEAEEGWWDTAHKVYSGAQWCPGFTHRMLAGSPRTTRSPAGLVHVSALNIVIFYTMVFLYLFYV